MEAPPEDQLDSVKISDPAVTDTTTTSSTSVISPKKPIQLGIVQSSTGGRPSAGYLSLMKKSRWDQAPGCGENEEESKEINIESNHPEESNIKSLIQKFEDITSSSKLESDKSNESLSNKPGRVKLVRTNFKKPEKPIDKPIDDEIVDVDICKSEKIDVENITKSQDTPKTEVISVSSSKALQFISSNYDSPSDDSSQEADNISGNVIQDKPQSDSSHASLKIQTESSDHAEKEAIEDRLRSSLSLKNESGSISGDIEIKNTQSDGLAPETKKTEQNNFVEECINTKVISSNTFALEENENRSHIKCEKTEISRVTSEEVSEGKTKQTVTEQCSEKENIGKEIIDKPSDSMKNITKSYNLLGESILREEGKTEEVSVSILTNQDLESETFSQENIASGKMDDIETSTNAEIKSVEAQLEAIELEGSKKSNDTTCQNLTEIKRPFEKVTDENKSKSNHTQFSEDEVSNEVNIDLEKPSGEVLPDESNNLHEDKVEDFVIITHADVEGYKLDNESTSAKEAILIGEPLESSETETDNTGNSSANNLKDKSKAKNRNPEDDSEDIENAGIVQGGEQIKCSDNKASDETINVEQTANQQRQALHTEDCDNITIFENKEHTEIISEKEPVCEETQSDQDISKTYNDGVDAKMEQIFSENLMNANEETISCGQNIEEDLISDTNELVEENIVSEDTVLSDKSLTQEEPEHISETKDSLLKILESEGLPSTGARHKDNDVSAFGMDITQSNKEVDQCNTEESVLSNSEALNNNVNSDTQVIVPDQCNTVSEESNLINDENHVLSEQVKCDSLNIEDIVSEKTCSKEKPLSQVEVTQKDTLEDVGNEKTTTDVIDTESGIELINQDSENNDVTIFNNKPTVESVNKSESKNMLLESTSDSKDKTSLESTSHAEIKVQCGIGSDLERNANVGAGIVEEGYTSSRDQLSDLKAMEESKTGTEDVQSSDFISEASPPVQEIEAAKDDVIGKESKDPQTGIEVSKISEDLVREGMQSIESAVNSKATEIIDNSEMHDSEMQLSKVDNTQVKTAAINENDEIGRDECKSDLMLTKSIKTTTSELPASSIPNENIVNEIENANSEEEAILADKMEDKSEIHSDSQNCGPEPVSTTAENQSAEECSSLNTTSLTTDSLDETIQKETSNKTFHVEDATVSDSHCIPSDSKQTSKEKGGLIEVRQQETIERSIDMLFEVPCSEQPLKSSTMSSASSSKDNMFEVSSETKKLFSEEIQKEMLKLSPEHEAQCEVDTTNLTDIGQPSPPIKESSDTFTTSDSNDIVTNDSCELSKEPTPDDGGKSAKLSFELEKEKDTLISSDDSDTTIQAIDSFLESDSIEINKDVTKSNSKCEILPIGSVDEQNGQITTKEEDSDNFASSNSINEKTNAEDVMLGVEGDLDLGNSLTYDTKKLDLSPSSEPSISEENYDLPGESYDKESLDKEQENTNLLSDALEDVAANTTQCDSSELTIPIPDTTETEDLSSLEATKVLEADLKNQDCDVEEVGINKGKEDNYLEAKSDLKLSLSKGPMGYTLKTDADKTKTKKDSPIAGELKLEESLQTTELAAKDMPPKCDGKEVPNTKRNLGSKKEQDSVDDSTGIDIASAEGISLSKNNLEKFVDDDIERLKDNLIEESSLVCDIQPYTHKHEKGVEESPIGETIEKCEEQKVSDKVEVSGKSDATSNKAKPQTSERKEVNIDLDNLIPCAKLSSKEKSELESSSSKYDINDSKEKSQTTFVNVSKETNDKEKQKTQTHSNQNLGFKELTSSDAKESSAECNKNLLEKSKLPQIENTSSIHTSKKEEKVSSSASNNNDASNNKTNKRLHSSVEESDVSYINVDHDNISSKSNSEPNKFKKTKTCEEIELEPVIKQTIPKADSSKKERAISLTAPLCESLPSKGITENILGEEKKSISLSSSSNQAKAVTATVEAVFLKEKVLTKNKSDTEQISITPKDPLIKIPSESQQSNKNTTSSDKNKTIPPASASNQAFKEPVGSEYSKEVISKSDASVEKSVSDTESLNQAPKPFTAAESKQTKDSTTKTQPGTDSAIFPSDSANQAPTEATPPVSEQAVKPSKSPTVKEVPAPVRVSARQKQRQAAAAAALAAKEKTEAAKSPGQSALKKGIAQEKTGDKRAKKSLSPTKELHVKISGKLPESGKQSPIASQKSPKNVESKINLQVSPKKIAKEMSQDKLEPITLKLSKEENPVIVRSSSLSPKKNVGPHSPQGKTLGYTLKIGKDSTTIIPKDSTPSPTRRESSPGTGSAKADLSGKVGYLIKDTGLTITPVAPTETQEQKLNKITLKLSKAGGHPEIKQENKSETWKAIRKLGEIDIVPVDHKSPTDMSKRKDKSDEGSPDKKIKLGDLTVEPSTSSGVSKLQGLLTQAPLNQSDSSEDGKFIGFGSPTEKLSPAQQQASYDMGMIRHDDSPQPPRKRGRPRKITSPDEVVHSVAVPHSLPPGLTAKDILAASLQHQSLQQHLHPGFQPPQSYQPPEDLDSSQPMVPLFDLFEESFIDPSPPTIFPDQVQPSTEIIMRSARGRPIGRSRRPRGSGLMRGHERGGPRGRPRGSRGIKRILEEMEAMSFPDPDQPITLENIDAAMGPRFPEQAASELTMALLRKSIEGKKEILEKKARRSDGSEEGNSDLDAMVREMKEKIEAAYQAELKSPGKEGKKRTPEKSELSKKSPPGLIPIHQKAEESARRKSADGKEAVKRKLSEEKNEESPQQVLKRKSTDERPENTKSEECSMEESTNDDSQMEVEQSVTSPEEPAVQEEIKTEPEPPPKPVKPRPKSKAEIKRIKREKDRLRREAKKLAALEALKAPPPNPCEEDTRMSASDPNGEGIDGEGSGIKKNRMEVGDPEGKEFTVEQIAEYQWPLQGGELYMIQEQISTWLGVKSFQRKYPDLKRRRVEMEERTYLCDSGSVSESMCDLGLTAVSSSEVLDIMFQDFPEQYEELRKYMREKQARDIINKQKEKKKFEQTLSKSDLKEHAIQSLASWNANLNKNRNENRKCHLDLQTWTIQYPRNKAAKMTRPTTKLGSYPVALIPGQYADYYKRYTPQELRYFPVNTVLYGPLQPNEMHSTGGSDGSQSESEDSSSSDASSDSSSEGEGEGTEEDEKERDTARQCKTCGSKKSNEAMLQCSQCSHNNTTATVWA